MLDEILAFIAPHHCYLCQKTGLILCDCCKDYILLRYKNHHFDYENLQKTGQVFCLDDQRSILKAMIYDYKLHCRRAYARVFAQLITACLPHELKLVIVPAPTIAKSRRQRGFGHIELVARELMKLGYQSQQLLVNRSALAQKELNLQARQVNVKTNLSCSAQVDPKANYLVIDDITTTGATLEQARRALKQAGARHVACLALIHA